MSEHLEENEIYDLLQDNFSATLATHNRRPALWYHINHVPSSECNLSSYFGYNEEEYHMVLEELGLLQIHKNGTIIHRAKKWGDLLKVTPPPFGFLSD